MFREDTVFVLGAGASWHYGYPTGEELVLEIREKADRLFSDVSILETAGAHSLLDFQLDELGLTREEARSYPTPGTQWQRLRTLSQSMAQRLRLINPLVIDYFLGQNRDLQKLGRLLIGAVLLQCEKHRRPANRPPHEKHDWYRFLFYKLCENCNQSDDLLRNRVSFVTFNYDISLEIFLRDALFHTEIFDVIDVEAFLGDNRIIHVYGALKSPRPPQPLRLQSLHHDPNIKRLNDALTFWDEAHFRSKDIRVIDPLDKVADEVIEGVRNRIVNAERGYILGYGFDENNSKRIGIDAWKKVTGGTSRLRSLHLTNFCDNARINKRAAHLVFGRGILPSGHVVDDERSEIPPLVEKSTRNVYDALALDFEML
jgi:hypothetical protein